MVIRRGCLEGDFRELEVGLSHCELLQRGVGSAQQRLTCHFKHAGLYDGAPLIAPLSVVKTYSTCALRCCGARCGRSLTGYVRRGN